MLIKVLEINSVPYGSTAKIMLDIKKIAPKNFKIITSTGFSYHPLNEMREENIKIGNIFDKFLHLKLQSITGLIGYFSVLSTLFFLYKIKKIKPDIIHLHNLHGGYLNMPMLFRYIKKHNIKVIWTLHDCWSFTGKCTYFTEIKCQKWEAGCNRCEQIHSYPKILLDTTKYMWKKKREWFLGVENMTIVTPSQWLGNLVKQSFLKDYSLEVINNGINLEIFKPTTSKLREKYNLNDKYILLGVAFGWDKRKGLDVFIELAKTLDKKYQIILVGTNKKIDKILPQNIISIHRTQNVEELVKLYTVADLFVQPTREENYPTVNMEALACGTPVITFETGGSPEILDKTCGMVVPYNDVKKLKEGIEEICTKKLYSEKDCLYKAKDFDMKKKLQNYIELYERKKNETDKKVYFR